MILRQSLVAHQLLSSLSIYFLCLLRMMALFKGLITLAIVVSVCAGIKNDYPLDGYGFVMDGVIGNLQKLQQHSIGNSFYVQYRDKHSIISVFEPFRVVLPPQNFLSSYCNNRNTTITDTNNYNCWTGSYPMDEALFISDMDNCSTTDILDIVNVFNRKAKNSTIKYVILPNGIDESRVNDTIRASNNSSAEKDYVTVIILLPKKSIAVMDEVIIDLNSRNGNMSPYLFTKDIFCWDLSYSFMDDVDGNGYIGLLDYVMFLQPPSPPHNFTSMKNRTNNGDNMAKPRIVGPIVGTTVAIGTVVILGFWMCWRDHKKIDTSRRRQEQDRRLQALGENQRNVNTNNTAATDGNNNIGNTRNDKITLTEEQFAALPQILYRTDMSKRSFTKLATEGYRTTTGPPGGEYSTSCHHVPTFALLLSSSTSREMMEGQYEATGTPSPNVVDEEGCQRKSVVGTNGNASIVQSKDDELSSSCPNDIETANTITGTANATSLSDNGMQLALVDTVEHCNVNNDSVTTEDVASSLPKAGASHKAIGADLCSICLEEFQNEEVVTLLPRCKHLFHTTCIGEWLLQAKSNFCPLCKDCIIEAMDMPEI